jgi:hypothetical protein
MNSDLMKAKELLLKEDYTCVLCKDGVVYQSTERGVKPLLGWLNDKTDVKGFYAADRVVGKAAAFLYVLLGVNAVYAPVISHPAADTLQDHGILVEADNVVDAIRNRAGTGFCPMEQTVKDISDPLEAKNAVISKLKDLQQKNG